MLTTKQNHFIENKDQIIKIQSFFRKYQLKKENKLFNKISNGVSINNNEIPIAIKILNHKKCNDIIKITIILRLFRFVSNGKEEQDIFRENKGIKILIDLLETESKTVKIATLKALSEAAFRNTKNQNQIREYNGLEILTKLLKDPSERVRLWSTHTIATIVIDNIGNQNSILESKGLICLIMNLYTDPKTKVRIKSAYAIAMCCREHKENKILTRDLAAIDEAISLVRNNDVEKQKAGEIIIKHYASSKDQYDELMNTALKKKSYAILR